jgi:hypothetical protein
MTGAASLFESSKRAHFRSSGQVRQMKSTLAPSSFVSNSLAWEDSLMTLALVVLDGGASTTRTSTPGTALFSSLIRTCPVGYLLVRCPPSMLAFVYGFVPRLNLLLLEMTSTVSSFPSPKFRPTSSVSSGMLSRKALVDERIRLAMQPPEPASLLASARSWVKSSLDGWGGSLFGLA